MPKVSVIVPIYGVEPYIERCARSLFEQTLDDIEYLFIDDCSPDASFEILERIIEEYPLRRNQVQLIQNKQNYGVSHSRQLGLDKATGEYIIHCDPDDWVELNMYELLYNRAKETDADLVLCDFTSVSQNMNYIYCSQAPKQLTSSSVIESISGHKQPILHGSTCNKLLKSEWCKFANFPEDISYCEDAYFWFQIFQNKLKIAYINKSLYYYRNNLKSLVNNNLKSKQILDLNLIRYLKILLSQSNDQTYRLCCKSMIIAIIYYRFYLNKIVSNNEFRNQFQKYEDFIESSSLLSKEKRLLLKFAMMGFHYQSLILFRLMSKAKRLFVSIQLFFRQ